mgnify:CR=1 FL=1
MNNPAMRALTYDELVGAYREQMEALLEGGVDALLIETIFDTLNANGRYFLRLSRQCRRLGREVPLMLSVTVSDIAGRTLSGQTLDAFLASVQHAPAFFYRLELLFRSQTVETIFWKGWLRVLLIISVRIPMQDSRIAWGSMTRLPEIWLRK